MDRCSLSWASGRGLLEVYQGWTDAASAGHLEEVYYKFVGGGQMQPQLGIWKRFIRSLLGVDRCSLSWGSGRCRCILIREQQCQRHYFFTSVTIIHYSASVTQWVDLVSAESQNRPPLGFSDVILQTKVRVPAKIS